MINTRIEREFGAYSAWREDVYSAVDSFCGWLGTQKFADIQTTQRIEQILSTLKDDKLYVAFVAEFSRGKSELINAIFFGDLGQRVVPSGAGRTTMCPTELQYEAGTEPGLRLLPIETRAQDAPLSELKAIPGEWDHVPLSPDDPEDIARVLKQLTEIQVVTRSRAEELGFVVSEDEAHQDGMHIRDDGSVEIPRWRHAIVNFPHPLLEQGLVILDTPGLNALGAEPELTLNMLSSAHAVIFLLAADAGVTKSDMALWRDHICAGNDNSSKGRLVVLNKIDVLWDELRDEQEVERELQRQITDTSRILGVTEERIFPISAQKGLLGKIKDDPDIFAKSRIGDLESALANLLVPAKKEIVRDNVRGELQEVFASALAVSEQRSKDVDEHMAELQVLNGKNVEVIEDMMDKVRIDREHLEKNLQRFQATRSIFSQLTKELVEQLNVHSLDHLIAQTKKDMGMSLTTGGLRSSMMRFFTQTSEAMDSATKTTTEIQELMAGVYKKFQEEHGLPDVKPRRFSTSKYQREMRRLMERHDHFIRGVSMVMTEQMVLTRRFYSSVVSKIRQIFKRANRDVDEWLKTIMSPMEAQVREHQVQLRRRLESIKRIHKATDTMEDRLLELNHVRDGIREQQTKLTELVEGIESALAAASDPETDEVGLRA
ncbi:MAG: dynamin family protein [Gammaproteobacteria bacterium]|nr:dynamin family protein [Gammaproteobacteria bacterium]